MHQVTLLVCVALIAASFTAIPAASQQNGHPLISPYKGVKKIDTSVTQFADYSLITGFDFNNKTATGQSVKGKLTRLYHDNPDGRSILEVFKNYEDSFKEAGLSVIWQCHGDNECFTSSTRNAYKQYNGIRAINGGDSRYLAGKLVNDQTLYHIALAVGRRGTSIDIVESRAMDTGMVTINKDHLLRELKQNGSVKVDGLFFALNESQLLPESQPSMQVLAELLNDNPSLHLFVVGHTDLVGDIEYNFNLSKKRADSVINQLVEDYRISPVRLKGYGVGPLAPKTSNEEANGRASNRRVEVVVMRW